MPALDRHLQPLYPAAYSHHGLGAQLDAAMATGRPAQVTRSVVLPLGPRGPEMHACRCSLPELAVSGREQLQWCESLAIGLGSLLTAMRGVITRLSWSDGIHQSCSRLQTTDTGLGECDGTRASSRLQETYPFIVARIE
jgi:hypothetical protein